MKGKSERVPVRTSYLKPKGEDGTVRAVIANYSAVAAKSYRTPAIRESISTHHSNRHALSSTIFPTLLTLFYPSLTSSVLSPYRECGTKRVKLAIT